MAEQHELEQWIRWANHRGPRYHCQPLTLPRRSLMPSGAKPRHTGRCHPRQDLQPRPGGGRQRDTDPPSRGTMAPSDHIRPRDVAPPDQPGSPRMDPGLRSQSHHDPTPACPRRALTSNVSRASLTGIPARHAAAHNVGQETQRYQARSAVYRLGH